MREVISTSEASRSPLYSQGKESGGHISVSGLVGIDVETEQLAGPTIQDQTRQALANCEAVLRAAGATLADLVEVGLLLADPDDFSGMNEECSRAFPQDPPCRYAAKPGAVIPGVLVSIRMTAYVDEGDRPRT